MEPAFKELIKEQNSILIEKVAKKMLNRMIYDQACFTSASLATKMKEQPGNLNWSKEERELICKNFIKHVQEIFVRLEMLVEEERFVEFVGLTEESIKDLGGVRLSKLEKKGEKKLVSELKEKVKKGAKEGFCGAFEKVVNLVMLEQDIYLEVRGAEKQQLAKLCSFLVGSEKIREFAC